MKLNPIGTPRKASPSLRGAALDPLNDQLNARRIKARAIERCGELLKETPAAQISIGFLPVGAALSARS